MTGICHMDAHQGYSKHTDSHRRPKQDLIHLYRKYRKYPDPEHGMKQDAHTRFNAVVWVAFAAVVVPAVVLAEKIRPRARAGAKLLHLVVPVMLRLLGIEVEVRGTSRLPSDGGYVVVANHRSMIDTMVLLVAIREPRTAASRVVFDYPWTRPFCRAVGGLPVDQSNTLAAVRDLRAVARAGIGQPIIVFPEGHRNRSPELLPFQVGAFVMGIEAGAPIVPVAIHNSASVLHADGGIRTTHPGRIVIEILEPIATARLGAADRHALLMASRDAIESALRPRDGGTSIRLDLRLPA